MKVSCVQENLAKGLSIVGRAVAAKSTLPVIGNILLATDESRLKLSATNLEIAITCWVSAKIEEEGAITVPAKLFSELINSMPNERVDLNLNMRNRTLNVRCNRYESNIKGIDAEEYPPIPEVSQDTKVLADPQEWRNAIGQVVFAAASDDTRPVLAGVLTRFRGNSVTLAAADGFRLSVRTMQLASEGPGELDIVIPARALNELGRIIGDEKEPLEIMVTPNKSQALFHVAKSDEDVLSVNLVSRLIEGDFPNYQQIIPQRHTTKVETSSADFLKASRVASFFARDAANVIKLHISPEATTGEEMATGQITVAATSAEVGDTAVAIEALIEGDATQIAFNAKYLADVLGVIEEPRVILEMTSPSSPGVFKLVGNEDFVHVVMPMHTSA